MSRKIIAVAAVIILAAVGIVGGTLAWFTDEETATNTIDTGKIDITILENGEAAPNGLSFTAVMPGDEEEKAVTFNLGEGSADAWVRAKVEVTWDGTGLDSDMVEFEYGDDWEEGDDGWYYYHGELTANAPATTALINSVRLSTEAGNSYASKTATINVSVEAVQSANNGNSARTALGWTEETPNE